MALSDYDSVINEAAQSWNLDPNLLRSMILQESAANPTAVSKKGAKGLTGLMPDTATGMGVTDIKDPVQQIYGGAKYLSQALDAEKSVPGALLYYHGGPGWRGAYGPESAGYVPAVAGHYARLTKSPAAAPAASGVPSDDDFLNHVAPTGPAPGAMPTVTVRPNSVPSDDEFLNHVAPPEAAVVPVAPVPPASPPPAASPQQIQAPAPQPTGTIPGAPPGWYPGLTPQEATAFKAGNQQAFQNVGLGTNRLMSWANQNIPGVSSVTGALGYDPQAKINALTAQRDQFNRTYGDNGTAQLGMMTGQAAATLPVMGVVNPLIARGASALASGVGALSPAAGTALQGAADFIGGAGGPSLGAKIASQTVAGGLQGAEAAAINSGQSDNPLNQQAIQGAALGALTGATIPFIRGAGNAISGASSNVSPEVAGLAKLARDQYGIQLTAPQLGMSPALSYTNSALKMIPGSGAGAENSAVQQQFNRAVARTFGEDAPKITPQVLSNAQSRIGGMLNRIENSANVNLGGNYLNDAARIEADAQNSLTEPEFNLVKRQLDNVFHNLQPGDTLSGTTYGTLIHKGSPLDVATNSNNSNIRYFAGRIKEALRDSLTQSLAPDDAAAYQLARTQYKNLKTIQPLTLRADATGGPMPSTGDISPAALRSVVNRSYGEGVAQAAPGDVPLNDLARIGQLLKEPPSSGTAERGSMLMAGVKGAELLGAAATGHYAGLVPAAVGLGAGVVGGRMLSSYIRSPYLANNMIDNALNPLAAAPNPLIQRYGPTVAALAALRRNPSLPSNR